MRSEDLKDIRSFEEILEKEIRKEVKRINDAGTLNPNDVKTVTDAVCLMLKIKEYESWAEEEESFSYGYGDNSYAQPRSHVTGRFTSRSMNPRNAYDSPYRGMSYGYDMGYSGHSTKDRMISRLEDMMGEAKNDYERKMIQEAISHIEMNN